MKLKSLYFILIISLLFFPSKKIIFAANELRISGKILDQNNNPVPNAVIVFKNKDSNIKSNADFGGFYQALVPISKYTIIINGPQGAGIGSYTYENQQISTSKELDFKLTAPTLKSQTQAKKQNLMPYIVFLVLIGLFLLILSYFLGKRKKGKLPESSSSN